MAWAVVPLVIIDVSPRRVLFSSCGGLIELAFWPTAFAAALIYGGKLWFLDRMAWLFRDMQDHPEYRSWLSNGGSA